MKKTKFILIKIKIQCGEYEFSSNSVHEISSKKNVNKFAETHAEDFYGIKAYKDDNVHYFNGGEVAVQVKAVAEITKEEYEVLNKFLSL
jgi:hypothetical protein